MFGELGNERREKQIPRPSGLVMTPTRVAKAFYMRMFGSAKHRVIFVLSVFCLCAARAGAAQGRAAQKNAVGAAGTDGVAVAQRRLGHLRHGINISDWFAQVYDPNGFTKQHFDTAITARDLDLIRAMGFDHVRLSVDPKPMFHAKQADQIASEELNYLDAAVKMILDRGLGGGDRYFRGRGVQGQAGGGR